jgi:hypothetical protein
MTGAMPPEASRALGRIVLVIGVLIAAAGLFLLYGRPLPGFLGRLPGDISVRRGNVQVYVPLGTCLLLSLVLTLVLALVSWWRR